MKDYKVTLWVTSIGYYVGIAMIALATFAGAIVSGPMGAVTGLIGASVLLIPFLMFCEGMNALVTIAINTQKSENKAEMLKVA